MKKLTLFLILTITFTSIGCGWISDYAPPKIQKEVSEFEETYGVEVNLKFKWEDPGKGHIGRCYKAKRLVEIHPDLKDSQTHLESVVFHEIGHCKYNFHHDDDWVDYDGEYIKKSIMHHAPPGSTMYGEYESYYKKELGERIDSLKFL